MRPEHEANRVDRFCWAEKYPPNLPPPLSRIGMRTSHPAPSGVAAMRLDLKIAILRSGKSQRRVAADAGLTENRLSEIVRGWIHPSDDERARIAAVLDADKVALFTKLSVA